MVSPNPIVDNLEEHGLKCWMAPRDVQTGRWVCGCDRSGDQRGKALVLVLSASAMASDHVAREIERAASKHKPIIAFRIDARR